MGGFKMEMGVLGGCFVRRFMVGGFMVGVVVSHDNF